MPKTSKQELSEQFTTCCGCGKKFPTPHKLLNHVMYCTEIDKKFKIGAYREKED